MIKNYTKIEFKLNERVFEFLCEFETPLAEVHKALCLMEDAIAKKISELQEKEDEKVEENG